MEHIFCLSRVILKRVFLDTFFLRRTFFFRCSFVFCSSTTRYFSSKIERQSRPWREKCFEIKSHTTVYSTDLTINATNRIHIPTPAKVLLLIDSASSLTTKFVVREIGSKKIPVSGTPTRTSHLAGLV